MGIEQTSCLTKNIGGLDTEITKINYHRKIYSEYRNKSNKKIQNNLNNDKNFDSNYNFQSIEQINSSSRAYTRTNSSSKSNNNNKITTIQKFIRSFLAKKRFKERIELLTNIIELDNPVNLIKDKITSSKLLSENKGEQLWKELLSKKKIIPFEDLPSYRKKIKYFRPNKFLLSTQLIYIDKYKNNNLYKGVDTIYKIKITSSANSLMDKPKEKENIFIMMELYMKGIGQMINRRDGGRKLSSMVLFSKGISKME